MNVWLAIAIIVVVLWVLGFLALPGISSLIHILLVVAVVLLANLAIYWQKAVEIVPYSLFLF